MTPLSIGQPVVCIDAKFPRTTIPQGITEGAVYTISWIGEYTTYVDGTYLGVRLAGVDRGTDPTYGYENPPFAARRFRPLVMDPLAVFRGMLAPKPNPSGKKKKVLEDVE